ncbi:hypothetical protein [Halpernia sp.]|uniref:hypothetical protein n=1 Tax=Halpernia sp. TaxID=2782209 RepID=UPI003A8E1DB1
MKILIFSENFFGYADRIKEHLQKRNFEVDLKYFFIPGTLDRIKKKIFKIEYNQKPHYKHILSDDTIYDLVLVINGKDIPNFVIKKLSDKYKNCKKILYIWDDIKNLNPPEIFLQLFDKIYTYSKFDADENPDLEFLPFFYTHQSNTVSRKQDAAFVGTVHSDRYQKLKNFKKNNPKLHFYFYLYAGFITYLKYLSKVNIKDVQFTPLTYDDYIKVVANSKCLIELPHPTQRNITTRAIEVIGTHTKLITTSDAVKNYDFYNPINIFIVKDNNVSEIQNWIKNSYQEYPEEIIRKYYIDNWLDKIFG